jgi:hypothetical protein
VEFIELMSNLRRPMPKKLHVAVPANRACGREPVATSAPESA